MKLLSYSSLLFSLAVASCSVREQQATLLHCEAPVTPDIQSVTLPRNLAPLRFGLEESNPLSSVQAVFVSGETHHVVPEKDGQIAIAPEDWQSLIQGVDSVSIRIQGKKDGAWVEYDPIRLYLSADPIDPYLSYRLIEPGYEVWGKMGLYQRNLETYEQTPILENTQTNEGCMNCHTYRQQNPEEMLFHLRAACGGTYVVRGGKVEKLNTKTPETISALVYPSWHPSGRYIAFSTNTTRQSFHSSDRNRIEVFDLASDVVIYDVERHEIFSCPALKSELAFETFPSFSPDGKTLYFCSADSLNVYTDYDKVHYSLCSISFDAEAAESSSQAAFGTTVDTLYNARVEGQSISFPRVSPNGDYLMYTKASYGNFSIWHKDADLYLIDLATGEHRSMDALNSDDVDSFHTWSSNGRWLVFSSRRIDGLYTRPYLTHIDAEGNATKPFPVPQEHMLHDLYLMKSYNLPEFMTGPVTIPSSLLEQCAKSDSGTDVQYRK